MPVVVDACGGGCLWWWMLDGLRLIVADFL
jgi:hypothetical protein